MACQNNTQVSSRGFIYDTLLRIDQLQKAANVETACEGCDGGLALSLYNTKPIQIYVCNGTKLSIDVPQTTTQTTYFRIENVRDDAITLRLITNNNGTLECLDYTVVVNIGCICCLQCFPPICCQRCQRCADTTNTTN